MIVKSAIHLARNQNTFQRRTKHIDIKYNFIGDEVEHKRVGLAKISTDDNPIDMMTKPLPTNEFTLCVDLIGLEACLMWCVSFFDVFSSMIGWSV